MCIIILYILHEGREAQKPAFHDDQIFRVFFLHERQLSLIMAVIFLRLFGINGMQLRWYTLPSASCRETFFFLSVFKVFLEMFLQSGDLTHQRSTMMTLERCPKQFLIVRLIQTHFL